MAILKTTAKTDMRWMEIAPPRRVCMGRRRPVEKALRPIAEERSLSNGELMDGLCPTFPAVIGFKAEGDNERFASAEY
uniref:Uncharacterized protein n=1 Tax=Picea sitchensis TaxID=3332 RepID=A9NNL9_PICSI|nr:unknown [Picea sitchensis]